MRGAKLSYCGESASWARAPLKGASLAWDDDRDLRRRGIEVQVREVAVEFRRRREGFVANAVFQREIRTTRQSSVK